MIRFELEPQNIMALWGKLCVGKNVTTTTKSIISHVGSDALSRFLKLRFYQSITHWSRQRLNNIPAAPEERQNHIRSTAEEDTPSKVAAAAPAVASDKLAVVGKALAGAPHGRPVWAVAQRTVRIRSWHNFDCWAKP